MDFLLFSTTNDLLRLRSGQLIYVSADGNYSTLVLADGEKRVVTSQLGEVERQMALQLGKESARFVRIGKSLIINSSFIHYIHPAHQLLILSDEEHFHHTLSASKEALRQLKTLVEQGLTPKKE